MTKNFLNHRDAALALLHTNTRFTPKAARFLGQITVDPKPLSIHQACWLAALLNSAGLPPLSDDGV